jgi:hypothetical protein
VFSANLAGGFSALAPPEGNDDGARRSTALSLNFNRLRWASGFASASLDESIAFGFAEPEGVPSEGPPVCAGNR